MVRGDMEPVNREDSLNLSRASLQHGQEEGTMSDSEKLVVKGACKESYLGLLIKGNRNYGNFFKNTEGNSLYYNSQE